jgi:translocation and assembly module TamA
MLSLRCAIAIAVLLAACASTPKRTRKPGDDYLKKLDIAGNTAIPDSALIPGLALARAQRGGRGIDEYQLELDLSRISRAYQKLGYLSVKVEPRIVRAGDAVTLIFQVTEGPRAIAHVEIVGLPSDVDPGAARALVKLADGAPFDYAPYDNAKQPILALLHARGYAHALLEANVLASESKNTAVLRYEVDSGPRAKLGPIEIVGASEELTEVARRHAAIHEGDVYSPAAIEATQIAIKGVGRFSSVRVEIDRSKFVDVLPVKIALAETKRNDLRFGVGGGLDTLTYQARTRLSYEHAGWPSPLTTVGFEFRPALAVSRDDCAWYEVFTECDPQARIRLIGYAKEKDFLRKDLEGEVEGGLDYLTLEAYRTEGVRARVGVTAPLYQQRLLLRAGWKVGGYWFPKEAWELSADDMGDDAAKRIGIAGPDFTEQFERLGAFTQNVVIDYRDDPVSPKLGVYAELQLAEGTIAAAGAYDYLQVTPDVRGYLPIGRAVLAARAKVGMLRGEVPPTERIYAGGGSSQRGFAERRLSPEADRVDENGNVVGSVVIGGEASVETSVELRTVFRPWGIKVGVVTFLDGGDVTETYGDLDAGNLHWAVGFGIRPYYFPVGPLRIEVAYRLNRTASAPSAGDRWNYLLGLGEAF